MGTALKWIECELWAWVFVYRCVYVYVLVRFITILRKNCKQKDG